MEEESLGQINVQCQDDYLLANKIAKKDDAEVDAAFREHKKILKDLGYYGRDVHGKKFKDDSNEIPNEGGNVPGRMKHTPPGENYIFVDGTKWEVAGTMSNIYRRTDPLRPAFTVMAYGGGGTWSYHYDRDRAACSPTGSAQGCRRSRTATCSWETGRRSGRRLERLFQPSLEERLQRLPRLFYLEQ